MEEVDPDESSIHDGQQWSTNTSKSRSSFSEAGVRMRTGMWSVEEKQLLEKNIERFLAKHPGVTMEQVVFDWTKAQRKGVYRKVGKGIRRPLNNIYTYLKRRYHPHETSGAYTPDEELKLMSLYEKYGARWTKIGRKMDRSPETVCLKYRSLVEAEKIVSTFGGIKPGKWSSSDDSLLEQAVRELSGTDSIDKPVLWDSVSLRVPGKSAKQCRQRWSSTLAQQGDGQQWGLTNDIEMINVLFETQGLEQGEIPWNDLQPVHWSQWGVPGLKQAWQRLRMHVPGQASKTLDDVLEWLYDNHVPRLQKRAEKTRSEGT